jgi:putative inorganic carbon (hco3(-)) transporter
LSFHPHGPVSAGPEDAGGLDPSVLPVLAAYEHAHSRHGGLPRSLRMRAQEAAPAGDAASAVADPLYRMTLAGVWGFLRTQPASYWLVCVYLFFEYVRPQQIYDWMGTFPWALTTIILCAVAFLLEGKWFRFDHAADRLLLVFTAIVLLSSLNAYSSETSFAKLPIYLSWVVVYFLIANIVVTEGRFLVFLLSFLLYSFKMSQHGTRSWAEGGFAFRSWGTSGAPGWFQNSGEFGIQMTIFLPLALAFFLALRANWGPVKRWAFLLLLPATAIIGIVASSSRGALLGLAALGVWGVAVSRKFRALAAVAVVGTATVLLIPQEQKDRLGKMGEDPTSVARTTYWAHGLEMARSHPATGIGYANWTVYYPDHYAAAFTDERVELAHNSFVEAVSELGYTGLAGFAVMIAATFLANLRTRRLARRLGERGVFLRNAAYGLDGALVGFMVSGFFISALYYPFFWINLAMTVALQRSAQARAREVEPAPAPGPRPRRWGRGGAARHPLAPAA